MKDMLKELCKPSSIYALIVYLTFAILAIRGTIEPRFVCEVVLVVLTFYFGKKAGENGNGGTK